jgi:hypothetical protein
MFTNEALVATMGDQIMSSTIYGTVSITVDEVTGTKVGMMDL